MLPGDWRRDGRSGPDRRAQHDESEVVLDDSFPAMPKL